MRNNTGSQDEPENESPKPKPKTEASGPGNGGKKTRTAVGSGGSGGRGPRREPGGSHGEMPDSHDLDAMLEDARRQRGESIELKWHSEDNDKYLVLAIRWQSSENQPSWECSEILSTMRKLIWNYPTRDLTFISNLVTACSAKPLPPEELQAALDRKPRP